MGWFTKKDTVHKGKLYFKPGYSRKEIAKDLKKLGVPFSMEECLDISEQTFQLQRENRCSVVWLGESELPETHAAQYFNNSSVPFKEYKAAIAAGDGPLDEDVAGICISINRKSTRFFSLVDPQVEKVTPTKKQLVESFDFHPVYL